MYVGRSFAKYVAVVLVVCIGVACCQHVFHEENPVCAICNPHCKYVAKNTHSQQYVRVCNIATYFRLGRGWRSIRRDRWSKQRHHHHHHRNNNIKETNKPRVSALFYALFRDVHFEELDCNGWLVGQLMLFFIYGWVRRGYEVVAVVCLCYTSASNCI